MRSASTVFISVAALALAFPALSKDKDDKPGHGHGGPPDRIVTSPGRAAPPVIIVVPERDRRTVYGYYRRDFVAGNCPPGLAKKGNGCLPPGQARKLWVVGRSLPPAVIYYPLPPELVTQLAVPPAGYEYVRVDNDVLLMEGANRMIADFIADLSSFDFDG